MRRLGRRDAHGRGSGADYLPIALQVHLTCLNDGRLRRRGRDNCGGDLSERLGCGLERCLAGCVGIHERNDNGASKECASKKWRRESEGFMIKN
jgi:hypothetical protein